jgi:hypothetical protein
VTRAAVQRGPTRLHPATPTDDGDLGAWYLKNATVKFGLMLNWTHEYAEVSGDATTRAIAHKIVIPDIQAAVVQV